MRRMCATSCMIGVTVLVSVLFVFAGCATQQEAAVEEEAAPAERAPAEETAAVQEEAGEAPEPEEGEAPDPEVAMVEEWGDSDNDGIPDDLDRCPGTPAGVRVDGKGCPVEKGEEITYQATLLFDFDSSALKREYIELYNEAMEFIEEHPDAELKSVIVEGYADSTGTKAYNQKLSRRRAENVRDYLVQKLGIDPDLIGVRAFGERYPVASNKTIEDRRKNRRVLITFVGTL